MKLTNAKSQLELVNKTPSFTTTLRWRKAENYQVTKRDWESFWAFYWLYKDFPKHKSVESFIYAAFASANTVKHREKSIELGEEYLKNETWMQFRPDVTFIMANAYRLEADNQLKIADALQNAVSTSERDRADTAKKKSNDYYDRFFDLCDKYLELAHKPGAKESDKKYAKDFVNMMGSVYFKLKRYGDLLQKFAGYENGVMNKAKGYVNLREFSGQSGHAKRSLHERSRVAGNGKVQRSKALVGARGRSLRARLAP